MDMKYINDKLLVERYLQGTLSNEEAEAFEEAFLASPELLDQLEAAERLRQGLRDLQTVEGQAFARKNRGFPGSLLHSPRYALAATVFLAVSLVVSGGMFTQTILLAERSGPGTSAVQIVALETVRGVTGDEPFNVLEPGEPGSQVVLMVDPGFEPYAHFRATITRLGEADTAQTVLQVDELQPGYEDMLALSLPASMLEAGDYAVQVDGWRSDSPADQAFEPVNRVTFRVR
jgi:hypothetical protein